MMAQNTEPIHTAVHMGVELRHSRAEKTACDMEREARMGKPLRDIVRDHAGILMELCNAQGLVLMLGGTEFTAGSAPTSAKTYLSLRDELVAGIATSDRLPGRDGTRCIDANDGRGAAMMELSDDGRDWLVMLRKPIERTIRSAGKPDRVDRRLRDGTIRLSPRGSFAPWSEERRGRSQPFTDTDHEILRITRRALFAMNSIERQRDAVAAQMAAEAETARLRLILLDSARDRSLGELACALAHELNQPLSAVTNYVNACRQELRNHGIAMPGRIDRLMDSAATESARAADLVRRLRNFIEHGEVARERIDLHAVIRRGVELAMVAAGGERCDVAFDLDPGLPEILADPVQIGQVVLNLVRNGLTAMEGRERRVLTVSTRRNGPTARISIKDSGSGIPEGMLQKLFEPFHASTTNGMGIGLSLCRSIVEAHGGKISARADHGQTEFVFTLEIDADRGS